MSGHNSIDQLHTKYEKTKHLASMEIDVNNIISLLLGSSAVGAIWYRRENKKKAASEVIKEDASAGSEMLKLLTETTQYFKSLVEDLKESNQAKDNHIAELNQQHEDRFQALDENYRRHQTQIKALSRIVKKLIGVKEYAEANICTLKDCTLREPSLGTFKTENPVLDEILDEKSEKA